MPKGPFTIALSQLDVDALPQIAWVQLCACTEHSFRTLEGKTNFCRCSTHLRPSHRDWGGGKAATQACSSSAGRTHVRERIWRRARGFAVFFFFFSGLSLWREREERLPRKPLGLRAMPFCGVRHSFCLLPVSLGGEIFFFSSLHFLRFRLSAYLAPL